MNVGEIGAAVRAAEQTTDDAHGLIDNATDRFAQGRGCSTEKPSAG